MLENWQIKVLEHRLVDYNEWADNASQKVDYEKYRNDLPIEIRDLQYTNRELALQYKVYQNLKIMIQEYESINGSFQGGLTDEEKVNIMTSVQNYKNRVQIEAEIKAEELQNFKKYVIESNEGLLIDGESQTNDSEINACTTLQELNNIHIKVMTHKSRLEVIEILNKCNLQSPSAPTEQDIRNCQDCAEIETIKKNIINLKKEEI